MIYYKSRTVDVCFNNSFTADGSILVLNIPSIIIYYSPCPDASDYYTPDMIPDFISISSEDSGSSLTNPFDSPQVFVLTSDYPNPHCSMNENRPVRGRIKTGYCPR